MKPLVTQLGGKYLRSGLEGKVKVSAELDVIRKLRLPMLETQMCDREPLGCSSILTGDKRNQQTEAVRKWQLKNTQLEARHVFPLPSLTS